MLSPSKTEEGARRVSPSAKDEEKLDLLFLKKAQMSHSALGQ
jgi:hypothetical protein